MNLFNRAAQDKLYRGAPLAARMRPRSFKDFVGQDHIAGPDCAIRMSVESERLPSIILWGPPGSGKTTLANLLGVRSRSHFITVSAVGSGSAELRKIGVEARERLGMHGQHTTVFIDEIHRFNKAQQDIILPEVENGTFVLIGATTENPSFEVISPLLSRVRVVVLKQLTEDQIEKIITRAIGDKEHGLAQKNPQLAKHVMGMLINFANGDARVALNALDLATSVTDPNEDGIRHITIDTIRDALQQRLLPYDKSGSEHYETISAFIKSIRASDPDAAIYYLARMIDVGEDPLFIARRMVIIAAEDVGIADPQSLVVAVAAQQAVHFIGMPEGRIPLAEATIYLAAAPKSNSAIKAITAAQQDVNETRSDPIPLHLRNPVTKLMGKMGYGDGYKYSHDYPNHFVPTQNLPKSLMGHRYYNPTEQGYERVVSKRLVELWGEMVDQDN